ncbi:interferon alpha-inducible protein 27-like protein 2B, partial [Chroicocephalus ridibundus]|uniref:interferon alpha-inducible protein 27-like protein 2B n=1 Tax=Chroicocephalus ridibundus TaxID=1192867 RepID=UPI002FDD79AF
SRRDHGTGVGSLPRPARRAHRSPGTPRPREGVGGRVFPGSEPPPGAGEPRPRCPAKGGGRFRPRLWENETARSRFSGIRGRDVTRGPCRQHRAPAQLRALGGGGRRGPGSERTPHTSRSSAARPGQPTMDFLGIVMGATAGLGLAAVGVPMAVGALGFTAAGITAGSVAAKMMSAAAIANGGGVAAGSTVAVLQSIGAAGVPTAVKATLTAIGAATGAARF